MASNGVQKAGLVESTVIKRIGDRLRQIPNRRVEDVSLETPSPLHVWVKLTGFSGGFYQWKLRFPDPANPGQFVDDPAGQTGDHAYVPGNADNGALVGKDVRIKPTSSAAGVTYFAILQGGSSLIAFTITANATGAGYYTGTELTAPATLPDGTADLVTSQFGSGASDLLIANLSEAGGKSNTGHDLTATTNTDHFAISGIGLCLGTNAGGKRVVLTDKQFVGCT